ncbi:hypothetical protein ES288_A08G105200v1 [Gossypium darwinii]|uniref:Uncharacterized protein n=1 Tax=Gossypium darwinii TaxID=34276 RepID=A0A5D2FJS4_GOSDA|nr:hypothetical protein ES288_A08G105200v1 [Gossypium darwinii]
MDRTTQEEVSQQATAGFDNSDRNLAVVEITAELASEGEALSTEGVPDVHQIASNFKENVTGVGMVDVGSLDSGKHTAVAFFENKTPMFSNSPLASVGALNSGKGLKIKGKKSKLNKSLHRGNVRFKHASHHRVSLKNPWSSWPKVFRPLQRRILMMVVIPEMMNRLRGLLPLGRLRL